MWMFIFISMVVGRVGRVGGDKMTPIADGSRLGNWPTRHPTLRLCWCASAMNIHMIYRRTYNSNNKLNR